MSNSFFNESFAGFIRVRAINGSADSASALGHFLQSHSGRYSKPQAGTVPTHRI